MKKNAVIAAPCIGRQFGIIGKRAVFFTSVEYAESKIVSEWVASLPTSFNVRQQRIFGERAFSREFSNLKSEAAGLEQLQLEELRDWLEVRLDSEGEQIELLGIAVPSSFAKLLGVLIICSVQLYAKIHLSQATKRLNRSAKGDPGAFQPWVLLYEDSVPRFVSFLLISTPTIAATCVFWLSAQESSLDSVTTIVSVVFLLLSGFIMLWSLLTKRELQVAVKRHTTAEEST